MASADAAAAVAAAAVDHHSPGRGLKRAGDKLPDEFSNAVRRRLEKSSRTGQACDRCKVRKIRCDATPGGCTPCRQNNTECKTIDRITGKATIRGHQDRLEDENRILRQKCEEYGAQLKDLGIEVAPIQLPPLYQPPPSQNWTASATPWADSLQNGQQPLPSFNSTASSLLQALPSFRNGAPGDNYLGVGSTNSFLSTITGTSLQIFGMKIDVADFAPHATDDISSPASYEFFISAVLNRLPQSNEEVRLPATFAEMSQYAEWYFKTLNTYTPVIMKPQFMEIAQKMYSDPSFKPTVAETVWMHMVLAHMKYQVGQRNNNRTSVDEAHAHYRYSLGFFYDLHISHKLEDLQALALICVHLRNFPKPGAAWIMTRQTLDMALELGLHRSAKAWAEESNMDNYEIETRKRVWWTLHGLHVHLSGKLGRPMPIRLEDVDIEFPEPVSDAMPGEPAKCSFLVGIEACKITALLSQMYSAIYTLRRDPSMHEATVRRLEEMLHQWRSAIPAELSDHTRCEGEEKVSALYVSFWDAEFQLLLHHPAICLSSNAENVTQNSNICLMAATKMLQVVEEMNKFNCLDPPWINVTVYLAAIFTTLFVQSQRQEPLSLIEMEKLRRDMAIWLKIMGELGRILGSGDRLQESIRSIIDQALGAIAHRLSIAKPQSQSSQVDPTAAMVAAAIASEANRMSQEQAAASGEQDGIANSVFASYSNANSTGDVKRPPSGYLQSDGANQASSYPANTQPGYAYPDPSVASHSVPTYGSANGNTAAAAAANAFAAEQGYVPASSEQPIPNADSQGTGASMSTSQAQNQEGYSMYNTPAQQATQQQLQQDTAANAVMYSIGTAVGGAPHPQTDWLKWSQTFQPMQGQGQDYLSGANTLMTLRGTDGSANGTAGAAVGTSAEGRASSIHSQWPTMLFTDGSAAIAPQADGGGN